MNFSYSYKHDFFELNESFFFSFWFLFFYFSSLLLVGKVNMTGC